MGNSVSREKANEKKPLPSGNSVRPSESSRLGVPRQSADTAGKPPSSRMGGVPPQGSIYDSAASHASLYTSAESHGSVYNSAASHGLPQSSAASQESFGSGAATPRGVAEPTQGVERQIPVENIQTAATVGDAEDAAKGDAEDATTPTQACHTAQAIHHPVRALHPHHPHHHPENSSLHSVPSFRHVNLEEAYEEENFDDFVFKYGDVKVQYIKAPVMHSWFIMKPYALNYFYRGTLYRTRGERGESSKIELFLDLMYVGIVSNLAASATEAGTGASLLMYVLLFFPVWQVWNDHKDFMNYYFNEDLTQKLYILWILALLVIYVNSAPTLLEGHLGTAAVVIPYMICRLSLATGLWVYSFYIPQHRVQQRIFATLTFVTSFVWISVIFARSTRLKIGLAFMSLVLENLAFIISYNTYTRRKLKLKYSTALNIEHEVERYAAFYVIAIGEFLYKVVAGTNLGRGLSENAGRGIMLVVIAYVLMWLYFSGDGSRKAVHAIRRNGITAAIWILAHGPLMASLILAADASGDLCGILPSAENGREESSESAEGEAEGGETGGEAAVYAKAIRLLANAGQRLPELESLAESAKATASSAFARLAEESGEEEEDETAKIKALSYMFTGGLAVSLVCMTVLAFCDKSRDSPEAHRVPKYARLLPRIPFAVIFVCLSVAELRITKLIATIMCLLILLMVYELYVGLESVNAFIDAASRKSIDHSRHDHDDKSHHDEEWAEQRHEEAEEEEEREERMAVALQNERAERALENPQ